MTIFGMEIIFGWANCIISLKKEKLPIDIKVRKIKHIYNWNSNFLEKLMFYILTNNKYAEISIFVRIHF